MKRNIPIILTASDPGQCASALGHILRSDIPVGTPILVVAFGPSADQIQFAPPEGALFKSQPGFLSVPKILTHEEAANLGYNNLPNEIVGAVFLDHTARVCGDWYQEMAAAFTPTTTHGMGNIVLHEVNNVGLVAPCCDQTTSNSQRLELTEQESQMGLQQYCAARSQHFPSGSASLATTVDGFCVMLSQSALHSLEEGLDGILDTSLGSFAWKDVCYRLQQAEFCSVVSEKIFVGRDSYIPLGHQALGSVNDRLRFYAKHTPSVERVAAVVHVPFRGWQDMVSMRACVKAVSSHVDAVCLVSTGNPLEVLDDPQAPPFNRLSTEDKALFKGSNGASAGVIEGYLATWLAKTTGLLPALCGARVCDGTKGSVVTKNASMRLAEKVGADAVLVLNHDEILEEHVTRDVIRRILSHPNPLVRCFDVGFSHLYDAPTLVRNDAPFGHGGKYVGGAHGARLYRFIAGKAGAVFPGQNTGLLPEFGQESYRVANIRYRRHRTLHQKDRERLGVAGSSENLRIDRWNPDSRLGLHALVWEEEEPEDIARWMDDIHGLVDESVLVWTGAWSEQDKHWTFDQPKCFSMDAWPKTGPSRTMAAVAYLHGMNWVHEPLDDNISQARNAGIHHLSENPNLDWAMFIDPDEWLNDPLKDGMSIRNMVTSTRYGWLFQVVNYRQDAAPTISDSIRMSRLDSKIPLRMNGRVHEGFGDAIRELQANDIHPRIIYAPFMLQHRGLAKDAGSLDTKLEKYERLLRLQLEDDPKDPGAWVSLGWHYFNDGHPDLGAECYRRGLECAGTSYLPFKEMGYHYLRLANALFRECDKRLTSTHQFHGLLQQMRKWLEENAPDAPVIPRAKHREPLPLPDFE